MMVLHAVCGEKKKKKSLSNGPVKLYLYLDLRWLQHQSSVVVAVIVVAYLLPIQNPATTSDGLYFLLCILFC